MTEPAPLLNGPLDPLDYPFVFTQRPLLTPEEFLKEGEQRWPELDTGSIGMAQLEALHRDGVLLPVYRVEADLRAARRVAREEGSTLEDVLRRFRARDRLPDHMDEGTLFRPVHQPFRPWRTFKRPSEMGPVWTSIFLYSPYQLLALPVLKEYHRHLRPRRRKDEPFNVTFRFIRPAVFSHGKQRLDAIQDLIPILSILEARYLPEVPDRTSIRLSSVTRDEWHEYKRSFNPVAILQRLTWQPDRLVEAADKLLYVAHGLDPLGAWHDLLRLGSRDKLATLRNDALITYDYRIAAELLLRFYEDLANAGAASALPPFGRYWHVQQERLSTTRTELDRVLTDYGLSPHPSLVLALEGETEMVIMPRVMDCLGLPHHQSFIRFFNYGGVDKSFDLVVRYVAIPFLGGPLNNLSNQTVVPFDRPPTKFLLVADPEGKLAQKGQREDWRRVRLSEIFSSLPPDLQTEATKQQLDNLVEIDSWGAGQCFEFANFDVSDLAQALGVPEKEVATLRKGGKFNKKSLKGLWEELARTGHPLSSQEPPSKAALAHALWPLLEAKILAAQTAGNPESIPVVRVAVHAWRLAASTRRAQVALLPEHVTTSITAATATDMEG